MEPGAKQLIEVVIAVIVGLALIAVAVAIFKNGDFQDRVEDELDKIQSTTSYVMPTEEETFVFYA